MIESSTSVFRLASNGDPKEIRKIDNIEQKLIEMLRESFHHMEQVLNQSTTMLLARIQVGLASSYPMVGSRGPPSRGTCGEKDT